jgi:GDPmannose 4,6-dehydratase
MTTAIITGVTGQDGSYLAELLLDMGYTVVGTSRDAKNARSKLSNTLSKNVNIVSLDMKSQAEINDLILEYRPEEIYNLAGLTSGAKMFVDPVDIADINGLAVARILNAITNIDKKIRFCQAGSSELFGGVIETPQTEHTPFKPRSPYGAAKLYAHTMTEIYRKHHGLFACSAILFNHESPRRGTEFVTRKVTRAAALIKLGMENELQLEDLSAQRDWGYAGDYVRAMFLMMKQPKPVDYVISTGILHSVQDLCYIAFNHLNLNYKDFVVEKKNISRRAESVPLVGDSKLAKLQIGWSASVGFDQMICRMVDEDLKNLTEKGNSHE